MQVFLANKILMNNFFVKHQRPSASADPHPSKEAVVTKFFSDRYVFMIW